MLLSWDSCLPPPDKATLSNPSTPQETPELRELRLRKKYEQALEAHRLHQTTVAKCQLEQIAMELTTTQKTRPTRSAARVGEKRPRENTPLWERRLIFAVYRNLAEVCFDSDLYVESLDASAKALDEDNSDFLVWIRAAKAASLCGRLHVARRAYEAALVLRPGHWLCKKGYQAVLRAIGDADEDIAGDGDASLDQDVKIILENRAKFWEKEKEERRKKEVQGPEVIRLEELTWACLVDALRVCLERRLGGGGGEGEELLVGHPVKFEYVPMHLGLEEENRANRGQDQVVVLSSDPEEQTEEGGEEEEDSDIIEIPIATDGDDVSGDDLMRDVGETDTTPLQVKSSIESGRESDIDVAGPATAHGEMRTGTEVGDATDVGGDKVAIAESKSGASSEGDLKEKAPMGSDMEIDEGVGSAFQEDLGAHPNIVKTEATVEKRQEVRRSSRQKQQADMANLAEKRVQTRTVVGGKVVAQEDKQLIETMLKMCLNKETTEQGTGKSTNEGNDAGLSDNHASPEKKKSRLSKERACSWVKIVDERTEACAVTQYIKSLETNNSGPTVLLLRVLSSLSKLKVTQYAPTIALLWSTLRAKLQLHMPESPATTAMIVEALLVSGKKAGKAKARRFQEARRLLSHVRVSSDGDHEDNFLKVRTAWLWSHLHECLGEMQQSFVAAEQTLTVLQSMKEWKGELVPESLGPDLSGYKFEELAEVIQRRISGLKMARDLEKAQQELSKIVDGDSDAAKRTVSILSTSVHNSIRQLSLDSWNGDDLKIEFSDATEQEQWEKKLDAETELEPQLAVFGDACAKSADVVGELVCFSVRLRMAVHYYAAKVRSEMESDGGPVHGDSDSSVGRLTDLLVQIRKYVSIIKKLSVPSTANLWRSEAEVSGWSMEQAVTIASITLTSLVALIITHIPLLKYSQTNTELGSSQKNKRLAFTRCMLAFARCLLLIYKSRGKSGDTGKTVSLSDFQIDRAIAQQMLQVVSFCLKALVARGCCREEGTSGALIKLYVKFLCIRLEQLALEKENCIRLEKTKQSHLEGDKLIFDRNAVGVIDDSMKESGRALKSPELSEFSNDNSHKPESHSQGNWDDVAVIRHELAQCFQCLYQIQELESSYRSGSGFHDDDRWLEDGCRVSRHIGLSYSTGDPGGGVANMDTDVCNSVYLFYRRQIFEAICLRRRDGGRAKRLRDVLSRLAGNLPEDPPPGLKMLPFTALDNIVTYVVEKTDDISREAAENVSRLEKEWNRCTPAGGLPKQSPENCIQNAQLSTTFFEVFALHAMSTFVAHDADYKKHRTAERRKRPKEVADRLFAASSECLIALRCRPWSVGAWILLGRIFVEISDLALDERELGLSSFGLYRPDDLATLSDGDMVETIFGRAEACFGFAASLLKHSWAAKASTEEIDLDWSMVLGLSFDGSEQSIQQGIGDDGDLFGSFGLTNNTTSRPILRLESHPKLKVGEDSTRRIAAIRLAEATMSVLRLRELRYFHSHWTRSTIEPRIPVNPRNRFPKSMIDLAEQALKQLREGQSSLLEECNALASGSTSVCAALVPGNEENEMTMVSVAEPQWRVGYIGIERLRWYFSLTEARLLRKCGNEPEEYLLVFHRAVEENKKLRAELKQPVDIEPLYKLHASRMKLLRTAKDDSSAAKLLTLLERYPFSNTGVPNTRVDEAGTEKDGIDQILERKNAIAEDILSAMQFCCDPKSEVQYAEYYFKATYCRAHILCDMLKDTRSGLQELGKLFRTEAAAKVLDQGPDGVHRGYFYKIWNYRITDTGIEPSVESERKLVRWRNKILGLYVELLRRSGEWRLLAAIICRLKKRSSEDLPVDGALLDDLIMAYATTSRTAILNSLTKGILTNEAVFESSFRRTWDIYVETLRLAQGMKRVRVSLLRGEKNETGGERLVRSGRPRCLMAINTALRLEHVRWKSAQGKCELDMDELRALAVKGKVKDSGKARRSEYVETLELAVSKWSLDEKMQKLLTRRIAEYSVEERQ